jgi:hypothetical protein
MFEPAIADAGPLLVTARSADVITAVGAVAVLFPTAGSGVVVAIVARFVSTDAAPADGATRATIVKDAAEPAANVAIVQVTVPFAPTAGVVQLNVGPLFCVMETKVVFAGSSSASETFEASLGPPFAALIV